MIKPVMLDPTKYVWDYTGLILWVKVNQHYVDSRVWIDAGGKEYVVRFWEKLGTWSDLENSSGFKELTQAYNFAEAGVAIGMDTAPIEEYRTLQSLGLENYFENLSSV